jgi:sporulation protein YlmC with PRC-barrel domain
MGLHRGAWLQLLGLIRTSRRVMGIRRSDDSDLLSWCNHARPRSADRSALFLFANNSHEPVNQCVTKRNSQPEFPNAPLKVSNIIGTHIIDSNGKKLGDVKDVVIDPTGGNVTYAVVSIGGFLGRGEKMFAVPFGALRYVRQSNEYTLGIGRDRLQAAPGFDPEHWPTMADEQWNLDINRYYGSTPYWERDVTVL